MGNAASKCRALHPLPDEAIWWKISRHLTIAQWARVAGTCRTSWRLQLHPQVHIKGDLPVAGYIFVLKRCQAASVISITVKSGQGIVAFGKAHSWSPRSFENVKQLSFNEKEGSRNAVNFYQACNDIEAVSLVTPIIWAADLQAQPLVRRLHLEASMRTLFEGNVEWQALSQLETLRLCAWSSYTLPINDIPLELAEVHSLRHLHIENWSPKIINVIACCRVYAMWQQPEESAEPQEWLLSPCWTAPNTNLFSLQVDVKQKSFMEPDGMRAINTIMECQAGLELVRVSTSRFGSERAPYTLPTLDYEGRTATLKVEIKTSLGCWLGLTETLPSSKDVNLDTKGPLHIGLPATLETLRWYALKGGSTSNTKEGPLSLEWQLAQALSPVQEGEEVELPAINNTAVENHGAHTHKRDAQALRSIKKFASQCWGLGHTGA